DETALPYLLSQSPTENSEEPRTGLGSEAELPLILTPFGTDLLCATFHSDPEIGGINGRIGEPSTEGW
ncbi:MAG: hypothetical protein WCH43_01125, partial [Verrucomicrobiota bacterium]